jgi:hypothetical protein
MDADGAYCALMVEQVCHIEECRQQVLAQEERRALSAKQAAHEWVHQFAADFPNPMSRDDDDG